MDRIVVNEKIESLRRCIVRIEDVVPESVESLVRDVDAQDIVVLNLTRAIQVCVDIGTHIISASDAKPPGTMGEVFKVLADLEIVPGQLAESMQKAVGFRNIAIHAYDALNWEIVYAISTTMLEDFRAFAKAVSEMQ